MISFRASSVVPFFGLLVALSGCAAQTSSADSADTAQAKSPVAAQQAADARHMRGPHGDSLLVAALREPSLSLTDAQKSAIESALKASAPPQGDRPDMSARSKELAAQIRSGNIDTTTMKGPSEADRAAHRAAEAKALDTLHSTLTADQRRALVAALENGADHKGAKQGRPMEENQIQGVREHKGHRGGEHGMRGLTEDLNLTQAQKDAIKAKMEADKPSDADRDAMKARFEAMQEERKAKLETFASDKFDATAFVTPPADAANAPKVDRHAKELAIIASVLDASQREKLAQKIEQGPQMREHAPRPEGMPQPQGVAPAPVDQK